MVVKKESQKIQHFLHLKDFTCKEITQILDLALDLKKKKNIVDSVDSANTIKILANKQVAMLFAKESTRTRFSFEVAINDLGGNSIYADMGNMQLSRGESMKDTAQVLSQYVDFVVMRIKSHIDLLEFAKYSQVPVINALTDQGHPCQIIADLLTCIEQKGAIANCKIVWLGDVNNVLYSWLEVAEILNINFNVVTDKSYMSNIDKKYISNVDNILVTDNIEEAVQDSNVLMTDTWFSMGESSNNSQKINLLSKYQINQKVMDMAVNDAIFLHCLPAHRGEEVVASVINGSQSMVLEQAGNRLHAQKAVLCYLNGNVI